MTSSNKWNNMDLQSPPCRTWFIHKSRIDYEKLMSLLNKVVKDFESLKMLHTEAAILSRLIYRMKSKFRSDKGLKMMEKVNRALLNYLNMNLKRQYLNFKSCVEQDEDMIVLPSRQMLEFLLIRIQGFTKLMCRAEEVARFAANMLKSRISLGHAWIVSNIAYAVISRIWILLRHIIRKSCNWYYHLHEYLDILKIVGKDWLPKNYILSKDLKLWLKLDWIDEALPAVPTQENLLQSVLNSLKKETDDDSDSDGISVVKTDKTESLMQLKKEISILEPQDEDLDLGVKVNRSTFESTSSKIKEKKAKKNKKRKRKEQDFDMEPQNKKRKKKNKT